MTREQIEQALGHEIVHTLQRCVHEAADEVATGAHPDGHDALVFCLMELLAATIITNRTHAASAQITSECVRRLQLVVANAQPKT